jgi:phosphoglycerate dehydrogenase-like enzyme
MTNPLNGPVRVHVKNNHASLDTFPPTIEGEAVFTITQERFDEAARAYPDVANRLDVTIDWDLDNFNDSMRDAQVLVTWDLPTENLAKVAPNLKWIHIIGAGVEHLCPMDWLPDGVTVVNNRGTHADKGGEFAVMSVLMLHNHMGQIIDNQRRAHWESLYSTPVAGKTVVVVGVGHIGRGAAGRLKALGMHVVGVSRHGVPVDEAHETIATGRLHEVLPRADYLFMATPFTAETSNLLSREAQSLMPRGAGVINIGRARTMDYDALVDNLRSGHFRGAILDVFDPEPLPADSPLWSEPNLIVAPHVSADDGDSYVPQTLDLVFGNMRRYLAGQPLANVVRPELGY